MEGEALYKRYLTDGWMNKMAAEFYRMEVSSLIAALAGWREGVSMQYHETRLIKKQYCTINSQMTGGTMLQHV